MGQLPDAALGVVRLSWSPLFPGSWWGDTGSQACPLSETPNAAETLLPLSKLSHPLLCCKATALPSLSLFLPTSPPLQCLCSAPAFSQEGPASCTKLPVSSGVSVPLALDMSAGGHRRHMKPVLLLSCHSTQPLGNTDELPLLSVCLQTIFSSLLPLSAHGAYFLFCHSSIQQTVMEHLDVPAWDKERSPSSMELAFCDGPSNRKDISTLGCPECSREWAGRWDGERRANIKAIFWGDLDEEGTW